MLSTHTLKSNLTLGTHLHAMMRTHHFDFDIRFWPIIALMLKALHWGQIQHSVFSVICVHKENIANVIAKMTKIWNLSNEIQQKKSFWADFKNAYAQSEPLKLGSTWMKSWAQFLFKTLQTNIFELIIENLFTSSEFWDFSTYLKIGVFIRWERFDEETTFVEINCLYFVNPLISWLKNCQLGKYSFGTAFVTLVTHDLINFISVDCRSQLVSAQGFLLSDN